MTENERWVYRIAFRDAMVVALTSYEELKDTKIDIKEFTHKKCQQMMAELEKELS